MMKFNPASEKMSESYRTRKIHTRRHSGYNDGVFPGMDESLISCWTVDPDGYKWASGLLDWSNGRTMQAKSIIEGLGNLLIWLIRQVSHRLLGMLAPSSLTSTIARYPRYLTRVLSKLSTRIEFRRDVVLLFSFVHIISSPVALSPSTIFLKISCSRYSFAAPLSFRFS